MYQIKELLLRGIIVKVLSWIARGQMSPEVVVCVVLILLLLDIISLCQIDSLHYTGGSIRTIKYKIYRNCTGTQAHFTFLQFHFELWKGNYMTGIDWF